MKKILLKQKMMNRVLLALLPIVLFSIFLFGLRVLLVIFTANLFAFLTEYLFKRKKKNGKVSMAVFVTGTLLALTLPPTINIFIVAVGSVVSVLFGKMVFGGFGMNIFNPALVGRTFIYICFPNEMTMNWLKPFTKFPGGFASWTNLEYLTSATPIGEMSKNIQPDLYKSILGFIPGSMGETSAVLILLAGLYLIFTKTAKWQVILSTLLSFSIFSFLFYQTNPLPLIVSGGFLFGTIFMITDPISMPKNMKAIWIYGILVGFLTTIIRKYSLFVEGFMFAIILANTFMPIIEYGIVKLEKRGA